MREQADGIRGRSNRFSRSLLLVLAAAVLSSATARAGTPYVPGDVFAATGTGHVKEFTPTGTLVQTLDDTTGSTYTTGMCFDATGNLYVTNISLTSVSKFDNSGNLLNATFLTGLTSPESCVLDAAQNIYVGEALGGSIKKFSPAGTLLATYAVVGGSDWIDLAADQCTLYYDNEQSAIGRFNACTNTQLTPFATGLPGGHYALRILPDGGVLVAAGASVQRLDSTGTLVASYTAPGETLFFALNRDPNGTQFWTGSLANASGTIYKFNITPVGLPVTMFNSSPTSLMAGLAIFGELVVSQPTPTPTGTVVAPTTTRTPTQAGTRADVPTLSPMMLGLLAAALLATALLLVRR